MQKETEPIQQLEQEKTRLSNIIGQRESLVGKIGTDKVWIGSSSEGGFLDKVLVRSTPEATLRVGRARRTVRQDIGRLNSKLEEVNTQIQEELQVGEQARTYLSELKLRRNQLATMSEMVAEGNLTEDDLRKHQQDFEELVKLPQTNPLLQKGLGRIKQEEVEVGEEKAKEKEELEPGMFKLPDGKLVRLTENEQKYLLLIPTNKNEAIPSSVAANATYEEELKKGEIGLRVALTRAKSLRRNLNIRKLNPVGWEIKNAASLTYITGKKGIVEAKLYLAPIINEEQLEQQQEVEASQTEQAKDSTKDLISVDKFIQELPEELRPIFAEVRDSTDIGYARDIVRAFVGTNPEDIKELGAQIAGYLFETLAYLHLRKKFSEQNKILLSPQETFEIYYQLYPQKRELSGEYKLQRSIEGVSVPDGMLISFLKNGNRGVKIDGVLEYRLGIRDDLETTDKLARYRSWFSESMSPLKDARSPESNVIRQYLLSRYPNFPRNILVNPNAEAFLAVPLDAKMPAAPVAGVKEISIPVPAVTFGHFVNALMSDVQEKNKVS